MTRNTYRALRGSAAAVLALGVLACGGSEPGELGTTTAALNANCQELCRRYLSIERYYTQSLVGRPFGNPVPEAVSLGESYLTQAGEAPATHRGGICSQGNEALDDSWTVVQPRLDIYRDFPYEATSMILQCAADYGL